MTRTIHINEREPFAFTERVQHRDGTDVIREDVHRVSLRVFDGDTQVLAVDDISVQDSVFDTLQLNGEWTRDSQGFNFKHQFHYATTYQTFTRGGKVYRLEYRFDFTPEWKGFKVVTGRLVVQSIRRTD